MNRVKAHALRKLDEDKVVDALTKHRVSFHFFQAGMLFRVVEERTWLNFLETQVILFESV